MAPPDQVPAGRPIVAGMPQSTLVVTMPTHLRPRWRDLPALAWLVVRRLDTALQATPLLGLMAAGCATPLMLLALVCAHADGRVAAHDRHAVIWIRPLTATGRSVHTRRECAINAAVLVPWLTVLLFAVALGTADQTLTVVRAVALSLASSIMAGHLLAVFAVHRRRDLITRTSQWLRHLAPHAGVPLVLVLCLVADPATLAVVVLLRALREQADQAGLGVVATARDESLLAGYRANGFVPGPPDSDPASRLLYRPPRPSPSDRTTRRAQPSPQPPVARSGPVPSTGPAGRAAGVSTVALIAGRTAPRLSALTEFGSGSRKVDR